MASGSESAAREGIVIARSTSMAAKGRVNSTTVFHDREAMEDAVRALVGQGVSPQRILVSQGTVVDGRARPAPERSELVAVGLLVGAVAGATLALLGMVALGLATLVKVPLLWIVLRVLAGAAGGALVGGLVAIFVDALGGRRREVGTKADDFIVTVKTRDPSAAEDVGYFLVLRGGAPLQA
jgi:hypothetical protein